MQQLHEQYRFFARIIVDFAHGILDKARARDRTLPEYAWDDWLVTPTHEDPLLQRIASECAEIPRRFPDSRLTCSKEGVDRLLELAAELNSAAAVLEASASAGPSTQ